jgi:hypothetical protein
MEAHARTPRELFEGKVQYEIPPFQRPYVWNETDQWEPLWRDVARVAADIVRDGKASRSETHFLGAVVAASTYTASGDVARHELVDGQQRMTTLQLLLGAVQGVVAQHGQAEDAEALQELIRNGSSRFAKSEKRFKLWPSQTDRAAFVRAMEGGAGEYWSEEDSSGNSAKPKPHRLVQAYEWFRAAAERWISGRTEEDDPESPGDETQRIQALSAVLQDRLTLVAIDLDISDDAQLIFETLNDRGTPLLSADLIKNWLFQQGQRQGVDIDRWARDWTELDDPWWREEVRQGRLNRPRIDGFLQYWLTAQCAEDLRTTEVFRRFVRFARPQMTSAEGADRFLHELLDEAAFYRHLDELSPTTPEGRFHQRVLQQFDQATMTPMLLRLAPKHFGVPPEQRRLALESLESWVVRRALLFLENRATNRVVATLLKGLSGVDPSRIGVELRRLLSRSDARAQSWPDDTWLRQDLPERRLYGGLNRDRLRAVLEILEQRLRQQDDRYDKVIWDNDPQIEHIMPQTWRPYWNTEPPLDLDAAVERDRLIHTIGNLTLVNSHLNASLSNRPWTDIEAAGMDEGGFASQGKRSLLGQFSGLELTGEVVRQHSEAWTDDDIRARSRKLVNLIVEEWPGPDELV